MRPLTFLLLLIPALYSGESRAFSNLKSCGLFEESKPIQSLDKRAQNAAQALPGIKQRLAFAAGLKPEQKKPLCMETRQMIADYADNINQYASEANEVKDPLQQLGDKDCGAEIQSDSADRKKISSSLMKQFDQNCATK